MAEYYTVLKRAVGGLDPNVADARRAVYDKARNALIGQLKAVEPPLTTAEISRQRLELEEAIRRVERETAAGVVGAAAAPPPRQQAPVALPPERLPPPPEPPPQELPQASPQDIFRRAMQEAGVRGAEAGARMERPPPREDMPPPPRREYRPAPAEPAYIPETAYRQAEPPPQYRQQEPVYRQPEPDYRQAEPPPQYRDEPYRRVPNYGREQEYRDNNNQARLAPEYGQDYDRQPAAQQPPPRPVLDQRDRPATARGGRRKGYLEADDQELLEREPRRSRLPGIFLFVLIVAMLGGIGALAWSQRAVITDLIASLDTPADKPPVATADATPDAAASSKDSDRLLDGGAPPPPPATDAAPGDVRVVAPDDPGSADAGPDSVPAATSEPLPIPAATDGGDAGIAQKAILYEEPVAGSSSGVTAIDATVTWRFIQDGPNGPEIEAALDVPERAMKIRFALHKNLDQSLPASHLVEVVVDTPADFPGKSVGSVPRIVLKPSEESRGQPMVGAAAKVADGFFWIALSAAQADVNTNLGLIKDRNWIDLPLVYETGQRAILTFEKGAAGTRVLEQALAAWGTTG